MTLETTSRQLAWSAVLAITLGAGLTAQGSRTTTQPLDEEYTQKILDLTPDDRMKIDLINHMPLPDDPNVPSPLKILGYIPGEDGSVGPSMTAHSCEERRQTSRLGRSSARWRTVPRRRL